MSRSPHQAFNKGWCVLFEAKDQPEPQHTS